MTEDREASEDLLARARGGDAEAFAALVAPLLRPLRLFAARRGRAVCRADGDADDLVQETLARAWRLLPRFEPRGPGSLHRWLVALAKGAVRDRELYLRGKGRGRARHVGSVASGDGREPVDAASSVATRVGRRDDLERIAAALDSLPAPTRAVVERHLLEAEPLSAIAAALGVTKNAAWERLQRGLALLRRAVDATPAP